MRVDKSVIVLFRQMNLFLNRELLDEKLTSSDVLYLALLYEQDGRTQDEMAEAYTVDRAATTRSLQGLEKKGLVRREVDTFDRRIRRVYLTEKAMQYRTAIRRMADDLADALTCRQTVLGIEANHADGVVHVGADQQFSLGQLVRIARHHVVEMLLVDNLNVVVQRRAGNGVGGFGGRHRPAGENQQYSQENRRKLFHACRPFYDVILFPETSARNCIPPFNRICPLWKVESNNTVVQKNNMSIV